MNAQFCPDCIAEGVDCPLLLSGECTHCGRRDTPVSRRVVDYEYRLRFALGSLRFRLGVTTAGVRTRAAIAGLIARWR